MIEAIIKIELGFVNTITEAHLQALELSEKLECYVEFEFNGVICRVNPETDITDSVDKYFNSLEKEEYNKTKPELVKLTNQYLEDGDEFEGYDGCGRYKEVWVKREEFEKNKKG